MARGCTESDSEEERHDRFRSERNSSSLGSKKSLFSAGLQQNTIKTHSRLKSPSSRSSSSSSRRRKREEHYRSSPHRSRSRSHSHTKRSKSSKDRYKDDHYDDDATGDDGKYNSNKHSRLSDDSSLESGSHSKSTRRKHSHRSVSKERKHNKKENKIDNLSQKSNDNDTFLERFERRRPRSVENEIVENTVIYRETSVEPEKSHNNNHHHRSHHHHHKKDKRKKHPDILFTEEGELISEEENNCFGPALPPQSQPPPQQESEEEEEDGEVKEGPALPPGYNNTIGPALLQSLNTREEHLPIEISKSEPVDDIKDQPNKPKEEQPRIIGPTLPSREYRPPVDDHGKDDDDDDAYGPALPPQSQQQSTTNDDDVTSTINIDEDGDDQVDIIGPLPQGMVLDDRVQRILEERAQTIRKQMEIKDNVSGGNDDQKTRESWMLELPDVKTIDKLGLGARKFKTREGPDLSDRSSWTDTPQSKKLKMEEEDPKKCNDESKKLAIAARNKVMEKRAKESTSNRDKSLLELHQKELKKKKKKELEASGGKIERRPFSREIDLQTNRFDERQKKSIINKAQLLDSRFSSGENKYL